MAQLVEDRRADEAPEPVSRDLAEELAQPPAITAEGHEAGGDVDEVRLPHELDLEAIAMRDRGAWCCSQASMYRCIEGAPLAEERMVSFLPAASLLAGRRLDEPLSVAPTGVLAIGDPAFDPASEPSLPRLPGAAVEARGVGRLWGSGDVLVDAEASESELVRLLPGRAVVHLAAHGHLDEIALSNSAIVLAGADHLTVADLIGLRVDADLAVLGACDSGRGAVTLGGDVIGLTRGLLASGVRQALVSLWPVDDVAACATMVAFHEHLARTGVPAQATC